MKKLRILVTGGAGFIASHVADGYIKRGHHVAIVDNLATGFRKNVNPRARFYRGDIRNAAFVEKVVRKEKPHTINHHAAIAEVVKSLRDPIPTYQTNVLGTVNLLMAAGRAKIRKFIFSSTGGAIYGEPTKIPADETTSPVPLSPYGLSKFMGEELIEFYARHFGFEYLIFRYPNVYGPRQNPKGEAGVVAIFGGIIKRGKRPTIFGDGTKTRDYVHVEDIVRANMATIQKGKNLTVNIGWGKKVSDQMIFDAIAEYYQFSQQPIYAPYRKGEVYQIALDAQKARRLLGWKPTIPLTRGIAKTLAAL